MTPDVESHDLSVETSGTVTCSCRKIEVKAQLYGARQAKAIAHAHLANPTLTVADLVDFIAKRPA